MLKEFQHYKNNSNNKSFVPIILHFLRVRIDTKIVLDCLYTNLKNHHTCLKNILLHNVYNVIKYQTYKF